MKRGDVILVDWPFSDRTGSKLRPAIVVQADFLDALLDDTILAAITSRPRISGTEVLLDPVVETASGLKYPSVASCNNILTLDQAFVYRSLGSLSSATMNTIDDVLRVVLTL